MTELHTETEVHAEWPTDKLGRLIFSISYVFSLIGGIIMAGVAVMVVVSVVGRAAFSKPIYGDFELVAMFTAISIFLFLPYCQLTKNNVIVDLFLSRAPDKVKSTFDAIGNLLFSVMAFVLAWRSALGGIDLYRNHETTMILSISIWPVFPIVVVSLGLLGISTLYTATKDFSRVLK